MSELRAPGVLPGGGSNREEMLPRPFPEQGECSRLRRRQCEGQISDGSRLCSPHFLLVILKNTDHAELRGTS